MTNEVKMPEMPKPFSFHNNLAVNPLYTADQVSEYGRESAAFGFSQGFDAGYLAALEQEVGK